MAEGEELPPVVATLVGDDESFLAMLERDIEAARSAGAAIQDALTEGFSGITVSGAQISGQGIGAAGEVIGEQLATGIEEGAAGLDLRGEMEGAVAGASEAGQVAGDEIAAGIADGMATSAEEVGASFTAPVIEQFDQTGVQAGAAFASGFAVSADLGEAVKVALTGATIGTILGGSLGGAGAMNALTASLVDAAAEAGGAAGVELSRNLSEAAVAALSDEQFAEFTDMLVATAGTAGTEAGAAAGQRLGASLNASLVGVDLIGQGLSTLGESMTAGAQAAAQGAADAMASAEEATLSGTQAYEAELDAVFEAIWQGGQGMTVRLAAAMTETFQGIEADTAGFSEAELMIFREFYDTLNQLGDQAAADFAERMRLVQQEAVSGADIMASGMSTIGLPMPGGAAGATAATAADLERTSGAADQAARSMGGLAGVMNGPLMQGLFGISMIAYLPMMIGQMIGPVTQWIDTMNGSAQAAEVNTLAQQSLGQAITQDSGYIGDNTAATIQNILVKSNLNDLSQKLGVSDASLIEAAAGEANAQGSITAAYNKKIAAISASIDQGKTGLDAGNMQIQQLINEKNAFDDLTSSVVTSMNADRDQNQALLDAESTTQIFNATLDDLHSKMLLQSQSSAESTVAALGFSDGQSELNRTMVDAVDAYNVASTQASAYATVIGTLNPRLVSAGQYQFVFQQAIDATAPKLQMQASNTALSAVAALQLGDNQTGLNLQLYNSVDAYTQATTQAGAYSTVLTAMDGTAEGLLNAQAGFTIALDGVTKAVQANGTSLDVNTLSGAKNIETFTQLADAAKKGADAVYQNDVQTGHASQAYQDANTKLQQEKTAFEQAAEKAGFNKDKVKELADELYKLPPDIKVGADVTPLVNTVNGIVQRIDNTQAYVQIYGSAGNPTGGKALSPMATGGPVLEGQPYVVGDGGEPELFVPGASGYITPMHMLTPAGASSAAGGGGFGFTGSEPVTVVANIYLDGNLVGRQVSTGSRDATQMYARRNDVTGFVAVGK